MREYIGDGLKIDGRMIGFRVFTASEYFELLGMSEEEIDDIVDNNEEMYTLVGQILALKQSRWVLRRTSHSCGSVVDNLEWLMDRLNTELEEKYEMSVDDGLVMGD